MKRNFIVQLICAMLLMLQCEAQRILQTGDTLPTVYLQILTKDGTKKAELRDYYKDKPLILDFWATWCSACIKGMVHADSILNKNKQSINFLPVTYESEQTVRTFIQRNKAMSNLRFTYAVKDTVLMGGLFRFKILPHEVWISKEGVIKAITYAEEINQQNVEAFAKGKENELPLKDDVLDYDPAKPYDAGENDILYRSLLAKYKSGLNAIIGTFAPAFSQEAKVDKYVAINLSALDMFYSAYSNNAGPIRRDRIELHVKDSSALDPYGTLRKANIPKSVYKKFLYCYELILPQKVSNTLFYSILLDELNKVFPYRAVIEKRKQSCWVLVNKDPSMNSPASFMPPAVEWDKGVIRKLTNQKMDMLVNYLNWNMDLPVVDETTIVTGFDMVLDLETIVQDKKTVFSTVKVQGSLRKYGFALIKAERMTDFLVIRDK